MLTIRELQKISEKRTKRWHPGGLEEWSPLEWAGAMAGEAGEACNAAKKLKRLETGLKSINFGTGQALSGCRSGTRSDGSRSGRYGDLCVFANVASRMRPRRHDS